MIGRHQYFPNTICVEEGLRSYHVEKNNGKIEVQEFKVGIDGVIKPSRSYPRSYILQDEKFILPVKEVRRLSKKIKKAGFKM